MTSARAAPKTDFIAKMIKDGTLPAGSAHARLWCDAVDNAIDDEVGVEIELKSLIAQAETITKQTLKSVIDGMLHRLARLDVGMNERDVIIREDRREAWREAGDDHEALRAPMAEAAAERSASARSA